MPRYELVADRWSVPLASCPPEPDDGGYAEGTLIAPLGRATAEALNALRGGYLTLTPVVARGVYRYRPGGGFAPPPASIAAVLDQWSEGYGPRLGDDCSGEAPYGEGAILFVIDDGSDVLATDYEVVESLGSDDPVVISLSITER